MINKLVQKYLEKKGFAIVPKAWNQDYSDLGNKYKELSYTCREISREYNNLLEERATIGGLDYIKISLEEIGIELNGDENFEELLKTFLDTFAVEFEDDYEENL